VVEIYEQLELIETYSIIVEVEIEILCEVLDVIIIILILIDLI